MTSRIQNQDDWKRTQVRIPQEQYQAVADYAQERNLSLNSAMLELLDKGLQNPIQPTNDMLVQILSEIQSLKGATS